MTRGRMNLPGVKAPLRQLPKRGEPFRPHYASSDHDLSGL
jgi:hypothetical protein